MLRKMAQYLHLSYGSHGCKHHYHFHSVCSVLVRNSSFMEWEFYILFSHSPVNTHLQLCCLVGTDLRLLSSWTFLGVQWLRNLPANARDIGLILVLGRFWPDEIVEVEPIFTACEPQLLKPVSLESVSTNKRSHHNGGTAIREQSPFAATRESPWSRNGLQVLKKDFCLLVGLTFFSFWN